MFSCKFCEISRNTFFIEQLWWLLLTFIYPLQWFWEEHQDEHVLLTLKNIFGSLRLPIELTDPNLDENSI